MRRALAREALRVVLAVAALVAVVYGVLYVGELVSTQATQMGQR